jgi:hypothetical protein
VTPTIVNKRQRMPAASRTNIPRYQDTLFDDESDDGSHMSDTEDESLDGEDTEDENVRARDFYGEYDPTLKPTEFFCPFSHPDRPNPCSALHGQRKSKTQITSHLIGLKRKNGDAHHPINDPLWNDPLVKNYYLIKKPILTERQKKLAQKGRNKRHYVKRKIRATDAKEKLSAGTVTEAEYRKLLVGKARLDYDLEKKIQKAREDAEAEVQRLVDARIQELQRTNTTGAGIAELARLTDLQNELQEANLQVQKFKDSAYKHAQTFVSLFAKSDKDTLLGFNDDMLDYCELGFPTSINSQTFYFYTALCVRKVQWNPSAAVTPEKLEYPWDDEIVRKAKLVLASLFRKWLRSMPDLTEDSTPEEKAEVENMKEQITAYEQAYNASWDVVKQERNTNYEDVFSRQIWEDAQLNSWHAAQEAVKGIFEVFTGGPKSPLEICLFMNDLCHLVNGMRRTNINRDAVVNAMSQVVGAS